MMVLRCPRLLSAMHDDYLPQTEAATHKGAWRQGDLFNLISDPRVGRGITPRPLWDPPRAFAFAIFEQILGSKQKG